MGIIIIGKIYSTYVSSKKGDGTSKMHSKQDGKNEMELTEKCKSLEENVEACRILFSLIFPPLLVFKFQIDAVCAQCVSSSLVHLQKSVFFM